MSHETRLDKLYRLLKARTKPDGTAINTNYAPNVAMIRAEIDKLEERLTSIALLQPEK